MFVDDHNGFKVGDLITAYHKGYWRITKIERRFVTQEEYNLYSEHTSAYDKVGKELNALLYYTKVADSKGNRVTSKIQNCCDEGFCRKFDLDSFKKNYEEQVKLFESLTKET